MATPLAYLVTDIEIQNMTRHIDPSFIMTLGIMLSFTTAEVKNEIIRVSHDVLQASANLIRRWRSRQPPGSDIRSALAEVLRKADLDSLANSLKKGDFRWSRFPDTSPFYELTVVDTLTVGKLQKKLVEHYQLVTTKIQLKPWIKKQVKLDDIYTTIVLYNESLSFPGELRKVELSGSINDIFKPIEGFLPPRILLLAPAGHGKTTVVAKLTYDWMMKTNVSPLKDIPLLFAITLRHTTGQTSLGEAIIAQLLGEIDGVTPEGLEHFIGKNEDKCLLLLDGFDEYKGTMDSKNSLSGIVGFKRNRQLRVLVTSRPHREEDFNEGDLSRVYTKMEIAGFTNDYSREYIGKFYRSSPQEATNLITFLDNKDTVSGLVGIPLFCMMICHLWQSSHLKNVSTLTDLFHQTIRYISQHAKAKTSSKDSDRDRVTEGNLERCLSVVGHIAWKNVQVDSTKVTFSERNFNECRNDLDYCVKIGLLTIQESNLESGRWSVNDTFVEFFHKLIQEYCIAFYLSKNKTALNAAMKSIKYEKKYLALANILRFTIGLSKECLPIILEAIGDDIENNALLLDCIGESKSSEEMDCFRNYKCLSQERLILDNMSGSTIVGFGKLPQIITIKFKYMTISSGKLSTAMSTRLWSCLKKCGNLMELKLDDLSMIKIKGPLSVLPSVRTLECNIMLCEQVVPVLESFSQLEIARLNIGNNDSNEFVSNLTNALGEMGGNLKILQVRSESKGDSTRCLSRDTCVEFSQVVKDSLPHLEEVHLQTLDIDDYGLCDIITSFRYQGSFRRFGYRIVDEKQYSSAVTSFLDSCTSDDEHKGGFKVTLRDDTIHYDWNISHLVRETENTTENTGCSICNVL